eukprot:294979-Chlamydomonas_euryale.AAC.1
MRIGVFEREEGAGPEGPAPTRQCRQQCRRAGQGEGGGWARGRQAGQRLMFWYASRRAEQGLRGRLHRADVGACTGRGWACVRREKASTWNKKEEDLPRRHTGQGTEGWGREAGRQLKGVEG